MVVERLHIEEPEPPAPVTEPEKTFGEGLPPTIDLDGNRVFVQHFLKGFLLLWHRGWRLRLLDMQPFHHHIIRQIVLFARIDGHGLGMEGRGFGSYDLLRV